MCPACLATAALIAGCATSAGGVSALIFKLLGERADTQNIHPKTEQRREENAISTNSIAS